MNDITKLPKTITIPLPSEHNQYGAGITGKKRVGIFTTMTNPINFKMTIDEAKLMDDARAILNSTRTDFIRSCVLNSAKEIMKVYNDTDETRRQATGSNQGLLRYEKASRSSDGTSGKRKDDDHSEDV